MCSWGSEGCDREDPEELKAEEALWGAERGAGGRRGCGASELLPCKNKSNCNLILAQLKSCAAVWSKRFPSLQSPSSRLHLMSLTNFALTPQARTFRQQLGSGNACPVQPQTWRQLRG